jgi:hypothetical protein
MIYYIKDLLSGSSEMAVVSQIDGNTRDLTHEDIEILRDFDKVRFEAEQSAFPLSIRIERDKMAIRVWPAKNGKLNIGEAPTVMLKAADWTLHLYSSP